MVMMLDANEESMGYIGTPECFCLQAVTGGIHLSCCHAMDLVVTCMDDVADMVTVLMSMHYMLAAPDRSIATTSAARMVVQAALHRQLLTQHARLAMPMHARLAMTTP